MKRYWLLFSQTVTVLVAAWFVVATLQPTWLKRANTPSTVSFMQAKDDGQPGVAPGGSFRQAAQKAAPTVVSINVQQKSRGKSRRADPWFRFFEEPEDEAPSGGMGSGVIVSPEGYILTNHHVIEGAEAIEVNLNDGRRAMAKVIGTDPETDLALLKIELGQLPVIVLGQVDSLQVGDAVLAIGNPFGVGQTVTSGIVSALGRKQLGINTFENFIQTDAAINPGNSGGALVDANGALMGINTAIYSRSGGNMGIGFAVPVSTATQIMDSLIKDGKVTRGWIGVEPRPLNAELAESFGIAKDKSTGELPKGVLINGVLQNSPAAKAGLQPGDLILKVAGQGVGDVPDMLSRVAALKPGETAVILLQRHGQSMEVRVTPGTRPVRR
ncbi:trypsin-like peptidase domain-containing protein [Limnohabitans sp. Hippo4]|uniref:trypsin-like peptidase domain-containing protein n=1 Tax=Limnohabitans sp. Hippo4 TaxID=1826167 RepID=UPI000D3BD575|nr:trypsin-like peptidase domain-containing protein [Limnohabitans sp. Hippo4]PUE35574.1 2-alkenal reductase [Limnohabitans sp. Hippo4]